MERIKRIGREIAAESTGRPWSVGSPLVETGMSDKRLIQEVERLFSCFSTRHLGDRQTAAEAYALLLAPYPVELVAEAIDKLLLTERFLPPLAVVVEQVQALLREQEALGNVQRLRDLRDRAEGRKGPVGGASNRNGNAHADEESGS
jgi:hypothetical protein